MRIAILVDEIAPGSAPKLIGWPIRELNKIGVIAEALVIIKKDYWKKYKEHYDYHLKDVKVRYLFPKFPKWVKGLNFKFPGMSFFSLHHIMSLFFAHRAVLPKEFDIIIAHCQYSTFAARNIKKHLGIPFLTLVWDPATFTARKIYKKRFGLLYPFLYLCAKILDKFALSQPEAVITSGKFHHDTFKKLTNKPLEVLEPGCFVKDKWPDFSKREKMILTYDRWDIGNVPDVFLDILQKLKSKDITLTIGGFWHPESLRKDFTQEIEKRGLEKRVNLLGALDENKIMELASQVMVHVHPVHEAFGMQSLEAAACGCPIIIPKGSGVTDLFEHGIHGYFPNPEDRNEMVKYINQIFEDREKTKEMSREAWQRAKNYTWENHAKKLSQICNKYI